MGGARQNHGQWAHALLSHALWLGYKPHLGSAVQRADHRPEAYLNGRVAGLNARLVIGLTGGSNWFRRLWTL